MGLRALHTKGVDGSLAWLREQLDAEGDGATEATVVGVIRADGSVGWCVTGEPTNQSVGWLANLIMAEATERDLDNME